MNIFDWQYYLNKYPDLRQNGVHTEQQAIDHWYLHGQHEGRICNAIMEYFNWQYYLNTYSDLRENGVHTEQQAIEHWYLHGQHEGRLPFNINIKDILYCQPIFAPNIALLNKNLNSINSIYNYLIKYNLNIDSINFCFGGWCINDDYWNIISNKIKELFNIEAIRFEKNYGKAYVVNKLINFSQKNINFKYILTLDSDILIDVNEEKIFERLISCVGLSTLLLKKKCGLIALNQSENNAHIIDYIYQNQLIVNNGLKIEKIVYSNGYSGIAGGCLFIPLDSWNIVGGYRIMGVYAGDDAYLLVDLYNKNMLILMVDTIKCIHPYETNEQYLKWKGETCQKNQIVVDENKLNELINDTYKFWNN